MSSDMMDRIANRWVQLALVAIVLVAVAVVGYVVFLGGPSGPELSRVMLTKGSSRQQVTAGDGTVIARRELFDEMREHDMPLTGAAALNAGWTDTGSCTPGRGRYFVKTDQGLPYLLVFDAGDKLTAIYQFTGNEMPPPWERAERITTAAGAPVVDFGHYGVYTFFLDPTEACEGGAGTAQSGVPASVPAYSVFATAAEAIAAGWKDPHFCSQGRGRYFTKEGESYLLMYGGEDEAIGVYQFTEREMPLPWRKTGEIVGGGGQIILDEEHYGLFMFFEDPTRACKTTEAKMGSGAPYGGPRTARKSTPTPYVPPTPTPMPVDLLQTAADRISTAASFTFVLAGEPEGAVQTVEGRFDEEGAHITAPADADTTQFDPEGLPGKLAALALALQAPVDTDRKWVNNVPSRGIAGTVSGQDLAALIPSISPEAQVSLKLWVGQDGIIRLLHIQVSAETMLVLTLDDFPD